MATEFYDDEYCSSISGATLEKARQELNEDPKTRTSLIQTLRGRIVDYERHLSDTNELEFPRKDGKFLLRFLRARKFNVDKALQLFVNYHKYRLKFSHLLSSYHPKAVENVLGAGMFGVLPDKLNDNSTAVCIFPALWNYEEIPANDCYKTVILILDKLIEDEEVQVHGVSIFDNMVDCTWYLAYAFVRTEHVQKGAIVELQDSFPVRFKGFHMLNQPWYLSMVMALIKPFLSQKHRDRMHAHGENYDALLEFLDKDKLPENLGGGGPPLSAENLYKYFEDDLSGSESSSTRTVSICSGRE